MLSKNYQLRKYWRRVMSWIDAQSTHYRIMGFIAALIIIYLLWYFVLYSPISKSKQASNNKLKSLNAEILKLKDKSSAIIIEANRPPDKKLQTRHEKLVAEDKKLSRQLDVLNQDMIPPEKMADVLREILGKEGGLTLNQLQSLPVKSLFSARSGDVSLNKEKLVSQGIVLVFKGDYFHTLDYLKQVEALKWRIFWDKLEYDVIKYPEATVKIHVHTLSQ